MAEKILIVDDDQQTVHLVELMLSRKGYEVINAVQGADALNRANAKTRFDHSGCEMPDMDGFEVARRLREMRNGCHSHHHVHRPHTVGRQSKRL
jgi:CheY-like chemotaxis protein